MTGHAGDLFRRARARPLLALFLMAGITFIAFMLFPRIDIAVSDLFYDGNGFWMKKARWAQEMRDVFVNVMIGMSAVSITGLLVSIFLKKRLFGVAPARWLFVALCFIIGPGLVANTLFKDNWGRPRPVHIAEFGGTTSFELPVFIDLDGEGCRRNCSFVSGEGSLAFMTGFAVIGFFGLTSPLAISLALLYGSIGSMFRIGMGGHFLSDTVFAALFMAMVAVALHRLLLGESDRFERLRKLWGRMSLSARSSSSG